MPLFDENSYISPIAQLILDENMPALVHELNNGWNINTMIKVSKRTEDPPIIHALENKKQRVVEWLISKKANLNIKHNPAIIYGVYHGKAMLQKLLDNGADINAADKLTRNVITIALYEKKLDLIPFLLASGFDPKKDGRSLRQAVYSRQFKAVQMLIDAGFDVNYHERDQVHPENPSAVQVAARNVNDLKTVQYLVAHGADITLKDKDGDRPFAEAVLKNDAPLMAYLKALEPAEWHDETLHLASLKQYNMPDSLINICQSRNRKVNFNLNNEYDVKYIILHSVLMLKAASFRKKIFIEFVAQTDNYDNFLVWYPAKNCLAYMDYEHDEFKVLGKWEDFLSNPAAFFEQYLSDYF